MAYTKYSLTPANNTATPPDGAPEGMLPSAVNDTMRDMMAQIRDCGDGIRDGTYTMTAAKITGGTITGVTFTGNTFSNPTITGVSTFAAGTVSAPALTTTGDTNTGIFFPAADTIAFTEGGVESMRIDSSGRVGISTTSPAAILQVGTRSSSASTDNSSVFVAGAASASGGIADVATFANTVAAATNNEARTTFTPASNYSATAAIGAAITNTTTGETALKFYTYKDSLNPLTERMRIDSSGNVGIGTSSPSYRLHAVSSAAVVARLGSSGGSGAFVNFIDSGASPSNAPSVGAIGNNLVFMGDGSSSERMRITSGGNVLVGGTSLTAGIGGSFVVKTSGGWIATESGGSGLFGTLDNQAMVLGTNQTERMRITSGGDVLVGQTAQNFATSTGVGILGNGRGLFACSGNSGVAVSRLDNTGALVDLFYGNTFIGAISTNGSTITYGGTSDYRLKDDIKPLTNALAKIALLKPCEFTWKNTGIEDNGFIAHELAEVCPNAVVGEKDAVNKDGSIKPQQIDTSFLVATLTAAIQEQQAMIEELKQEVAALKAK